MIQNFGHGPTSLDRDVFRGHAAADGVFGVTEEVGGDLALGGRKEVEQLLGGGGGKFFEEGGAIVGRQFVEDLRDLLVAKGVQHFFLVLHGEILEDLGGDVVGKDAHEHGFLVRAEISEDFREIGRGEFGQDFAELGEIALANQFDQFGLEQVANHAHATKPWKMGIAKKQNGGVERFTGARPTPRNFNSAHLCVKKDNARRLDSFNFNAKGAKVCAKERGGYIWTQASRGAQQTCHHHTNPWKRFATLLVHRQVHEQISNQQNYMNLKASIQLLALSLLTVTGLIGCNKASESSGGGAGGKKITIALMPKSKGNAYFISCKKGADKAAKDLGVDLIFDGPTDPDPARQNEIIENWITLGVDAIAAACENKEGISTALRKAKAKGIKVITYDSDAAPDAREYFVNQATPEGIGNTLMDEAARLCGSEGEFAIITASLTAANMNEWQKYIESRRSTKYPNMKMVALRPCDDLKDKAQAEATSLLGANPNLKLLMAICSPAVPGAAEAVKQAGKTGKVKVIGLGLPSENRKYVKEGVTDSVILWKTEDLGYLTVYAAHALAMGKMKSGDKSIKVGALGDFEIRGDNVLLGQPYIFNKGNIDQFDF